MKVVVTTPAGNRVSINNQQTTSIKAVGIGASTGAQYLDDLLDVDASGKDGNETLVYDENTGLFVVKQLPVVDGGSHVGIERDHRNPALDLPVSAFG